MVLRALLGHEGKKQRGVWYCNQCFGWAAQRSKQSFPRCRSLFILQYMVLALFMGQGEGSGGERERQEEKRLGDHRGSHPCK